jgi:hypothetical protein
MVTSKRGDTPKPANASHLDARGAVGGEVAVVGRTHRLWNEDADVLADELALGVAQQRQRCANTPIIHGCAREKWGCSRQRHVPTELAMRMMPTFGGRTPMVMTAICGVG